MAKVSITIELGDGPKDMALDEYRNLASIAATLDQEWAGTTKLELHDIHVDSVPPEWADAHFSEVAYPEAG